MLIALQPTDALLVIDVQNDFMPGRNLAVKDGDAIVPVINTLAKKFDHVILTQDWHPPQHISFASTHNKQPFETIEASYGPQALWPDHVLQHTEGAAFHPALSIPHAELILRKGFRRHIDSYSAFLENDHTTPTGLAGYLRERNLSRLFLCVQMGRSRTYRVGRSSAMRNMYDYGPIEGVFFGPSTHDSVIANRGIKHGVVHVKQDSFAAYFNQRWPPCRRM